MAKHRRTDQEAVAELDQVLLELFAGQLLLEPAAAKRSGDPAVRSVTARPTAGAKGKPEEPPASRQAEQGVRQRARAAAIRAKK